MINIDSNPELERRTDGTTLTYNPDKTVDTDRTLPDPLRTEVIFATRGRAAILAKIVCALDQQTQKPFSIILSCQSIEDAGDLWDRSDMKLVLGPPGLPKQRNAGLRQLDPRTEVVVFFDDDFLPHPGWIEAVERTFRLNPDVVAISGHAVADGIHGPGISFEEAVERLEAWRVDDAGWIEENYSPYGCNMAFRRSAIQDLAFDERLVLYGWLEDRDFGGALKRRGGRSIRVGMASGVHLGSKAGRVSGRKLGYSQIVNPIYLHRKGTMSFASLTLHLFRNISSNVVRSLAPEPHVDRAGRLLGNLLAVRDLIVGSATPERAEQI